MITNRNGYHRYYYHNPCHYHYYCYCNRNVARTRRGEGFLLTRNSSPYTLHPALFTLHPANYTLNPNHSTLNHQPWGGGSPCVEVCEPGGKAVCRHNVRTVDIEGYPAHKKTPPSPRTTTGLEAWACPTGLRSLIREVALYLDATCHKTFDTWL